MIASVLKPLDDHRLYQKWGVYFKTQHQSAVHVFGRSSGTQPVQGMEFCVSLTQNTLLSRLKAQFRFFMLLMRVKPTTTVLCTFELMWPGFWYWVLCFGKCRFYYDVRENYSLNIRSQTHYSGLQKIIFGRLVEWSEKLSKIFVRHYFYTEPIYKDQLHFLKGDHSTYLPNYFSYNGRPFELSSPDAELTFLICGTLSKDYGTLKGIEWFHEIQKKLGTMAKLKIVGHLTDASIQYTLKKNHSHHVLISNQPLAHQLILAQIHQADYLLLPYEWTESFKGCTPTKLYEALALGTSVIIQNSAHLKPFLTNERVILIDSKKDLVTSLFHKKTNKTHSQAYHYQTLYPVLDLVFNH